MSKQLASINNELLSEPVEKIEMDPNTHHSIIREKLIEHLFIAAILKHAWKTKCYDSYQISRPEVDFGGYDLIIEKGNQIRHIQLKARTRNAKTKHYNISLALTKKPLGCVVVIEFDQNLDLTYHFFGFTDRPLNLDGFEATKGGKMRKIRFDIKCFIEANSLVDLLDHYLFTQKPGFI